MKGGGAYEIPMKHGCEAVIEDHPSMAYEQGLKSGACCLVGGKGSACSADFDVKDTVRAVSPVRLHIGRVINGYTYNPFPVGGIFV